MISVAHLTKRYGGVLAVDDVSFEVKKHEIVGLLGPNGAGKTTIMRILAGYFPATGGAVQVAGHDVFKESLKVRRQVGYLPENAPLHLDLRVDEYLRYRARLKGLPRRRMKQRLSEVKEQCGLQTVGRQLIGRLSRGFRQRVALADALVHDPDLLILDEPAMGLDPNQNRQVRSLLTDLARRHTILLSSHILPEVELTCQRVLILRAGRIIASDTPEGLKNVLCSGRRIVTQIHGPVAAITVALDTLPLVRNVRLRTEGEWNEFVIESPRDLDLRPNLFETIVRNGWLLRELRIEEDSLEDVYMGLTDKSEERWPT